MAYQRLRMSITIAALSLALGGIAPPVGAQGTRADYKRAADLSRRTSNTVFKLRVTPHWFDNGARFWYRNDLRGGRREFIVVDPLKGSRKTAFDHAKLADALSKATRKKHARDRLPIDRITFVDAGAIQLQVNEVVWKYSLKTGKLARTDIKPTPIDKPTSRRRRRRGPSGLRGIRGGRSSGPNSPDGKMTVFVKDHNLHIRLKSDKNKTWALTRDGSEENAYSGRVAWSPDSKKLAALRIKPGKPSKLYRIESSPSDQLHPKLHVSNYARPGDPIETRRPYLFDIVARKPIPVSNELFPTPWRLDHLRWSTDSKRFTFFYNQRGHQVVRIIAVDAKTGVARALIDETCKTFFDYAYKLLAHWPEEDGEIIWASERDGWNHLYLYDAKTGKVKNRITKGKWLVRSVDRIDDKKRQIWFRAGGIIPGQDPYHIHYARVNFDGTGLTVLTKGDGTHRVKPSPDGRFFIDTWSRVDDPGRTELRRSSDGKLICVLETGDITALLATGWKEPERFTAKGRDGKTDIWGVIYRPTTLDASKKYPVIERIYAGPHGSYVPKNFSRHYRSQELAELGFIVVQIDGMGTSNRSKAFHDVCWKNIADAGLPDRILWIKAAAKTRPYMDIARVGICGGSAGGQNTVRAMLDYADFYKVAVADAGCHDNRMDKIWWNEAWMSWPIGPHYAKQSNATDAHKLKGKLLLIVGEMDNNVDPASTMQLVNALIKADKDFDMLVVPGYGHGLGGRYGARRRNDYFVRHLLGVEPRSR
ncbi:MAG: prolyl oligopeptidase family serine peptidase [Phycisphaerae bacterium]|jgi:dipeptidyl aminopeptidase/acylaminoacyl peptidase|nr:prolyl oligopeptidase family serine peptidase [Phycisphaerae bacterium]